MDWLHEQAIVGASRIWRAPDGEPWLVTLSFAEVEGRLECVGLELRSFISEQREDDFDSYSVYLSGPVRRSDILPEPAEMPEFSLSDPQSYAAYLAAVEAQDVPPLRPLLVDRDALRAILSDREGGWQPRQTPRPLRAATLRALPLGDLIERTRRDVAATWRSGVVAPRSAARLEHNQLAEEVLAELDLSEGEMSPPSAAREELQRRTWALLSAVRTRGGWDDALIAQRDELSRMYAVLDELEPPRQRTRETRDVWQVEIDAAEFQRLTRKAASAFSPPGQKLGRPRSYSQAQLEMVARTYQQAYEAGSSSPTKDVARELHLSRSRAAKLVMRCRDPKVGLLGPTEPRRAGGLRPALPNAVEQQEESS